MNKVNNRKHRNSGSSFIMVVATLSFISILAAAVIVAIGMFYRLRAMNVNNKNNFYYVEKALDEIYTGVGSIAIQDLKTAYSETVEIMVYYDIEKGTYITISEDAANKVMKDKFLYYVSTNSLLNQDNIYNTLNYFISDPYDATTNANGVELVTSTLLRMNKVVDGTDTYVNIEHVVVRRTTEDGYEQSITTDLVVSQPEFKVEFSGMNNDLSSLYEFSILADRGLEITDSSRVILAGNLYAASDYYNKKYDEPDKAYSISNEVCYYAEESNAIVNTAVDKYKACDGLSESSMNSGVFVTDSSSLTLQGEKVIVPGTIAAFNSSSISLTGKASASADSLSLWCDNIVLGGRIVGTSSSRIDIAAETHVADDLEVNADGAKAMIYGKYYGYNYGQQSDSSYMTLVQSAENAKAHINSSSIVVNGQDTVLDLSKLEELVVSGRSYIETTKKTTKTESTVTNDEGEEEKIVTKSYNYITQDEAETPVDVEDYATGESISIKSNQLAYMPMYTKDIASYTALLSVIPCTCNKHHNFADELVADKPVITYELNGNKYYFFNFKTKEVKACYVASYAAYLEGEHATSDFMYDILNYKNFSVDTVKIPEGNVYSSGALSVVDGSNLTILASQSNVESIESSVYSAGDKYAKMYSRGKEDTESYKKMRYLLKDYTDDATTVSNDTKEDIKQISNASITPLNTYINYKLVKAEGYGHTGKVVNRDCRIWVVDGDVHINSGYCDSKGVLKGIIICTGDVTFEAPNAASGVVGVTRFEGMIVAGGKVKIDHSMNLVANAEIVKSILNEADVSRGSDDDYSKFCDLFNDFIAAETDGKDKSTKVISSVEIRDILGFQNWKRNVE